MKLFIAMLALVGATCFAAEDRLAFPELRLKDGQVLRNVTVVGFATATVMAKWDGGRGTIAYAALPEDVLSAIAPERQRVLGSSARPMKSKSSAAEIVQVKSVAEQTREILDAIPRLDVSPIASGPREAGPRIEIAGQCFVTTKGGTSIKLGGIEVAVYSAEEFAQYAEVVSARCSARKDAINHAAMKLSELKQFDATLALLRALETDAHEVWGRIPKAAFTGRTDADGRFFFAHEIKAPYVVFAKGSRLIGTDHTEYYTWVVKSEAITNPRQIFLSNDALWSR